MLSTNVWRFTLSTCVGPTSLLHQFQRGILSNPSSKNMFETFWNFSWKPTLKPTIIHYHQLSSTIISHFVFLLDIKYDQPMFTINLHSQLSSTNATYDHFEASGWTIFTSSIPGTSAFEAWLFILYGKLVGESSITGASWFLKPKDFLNQYCNHVSSWFMTPVYSWTYQNQMSVTQVFDENSSNDCTHRIHVWLSYFIKLWQVHIQWFTTHVRNVCFHNLRYS